MDLVRTSGFSKNRDGILVNLTRTANSEEAGARH